jgi:hypothetical protein
MSVVVSGPRRTYVLLLFWDRVSTFEHETTETLRRLGRRLEAPPAANRRGLERRRTLRILHRVGDRLVGLSFFVLAPAV